MSIQSAFNNALYSVSRVASYGEGKDKSPAEKTLTPYQQASLELKQQKLGLDKEKLAQNKAKEERLQEELQVKQSRTPGIVAQRKATADVLEAQAGIAKAQAGALKEKTAKEKLKRQKAEYAFKQQKASDKAGRSALKKYEETVANIQGQKRGLQERQEMLGQIQLEI